MTQLESLTKFFTDNVPPRAMQYFSSEMDELSCIAAAKDLGMGQYRQAITRYNALLVWERFPFRHCNPQLLMSLLYAWLADAERDLFYEAGLTDADPDWDITVEDEQTATIVLTVPMAEELCITEDENGAIPFDGKRWSLAKPEVWTALSGLVFSVDTTGAPVGDG